MRRTFDRQQIGLVAVILAISIVLTFFAGSHESRTTGGMVNNFLNLPTLMRIAGDASLFAIMAIGMTLVIISGGIDLSVGSVYALASVTMALLMRSMGMPTGPVAVVLGLGACAAVGLVCGALNGALIAGLKVHPFIVTLGTMWVFRGVAFVSSKAESILVPPSLTDFAKASLGFGQGVYPVPVLFMAVVTLAGAFLLIRTPFGRRLFAMGGNERAALFSGINVERSRIWVYTISGLCAGIAAFVGASFYGSASCADATGYELYVVASAVVGGASLAGGKGSAIAAMLGALLIVLMRQAIRTLRLDQNYEWIIVGVAIIVAVVLDRISTATLGKRSGASPS